jgi:hypothetical protein
MKYIKSFESLKSDKKKKVNESLDDEFDKYLLDEI